ncbi:hypothetical protein BH09SUM1_BH09SUM1_17810 [soil metagenome]
MAASTKWILKLSDESFSTKIESLSPRQRRALIRLRMEGDPAFFARRVLPAYCRLPFAAYHRMLFDWHLKMATEPLPVRRGQRYVLAAPRGTAKSTVVSLILVLHDILFAREKYILLLSATEKQAQQRLRAIGRELQRGDMREWISAAPTLTARTLTCNGVQVDAYGAGCEIRGISANAYRPTKIILDDAEASRAADSSTARAKLAEWFAEVIEYLGDRYTHLLAIGTVLHEKGLIASLLQRPEFTGHRARSIDTFPAERALWDQWRATLLNFGDPARRESARTFFDANRAAMENGATVLWPEKEDIEELMTQLTLQGRRAFFQEKQNTPLGPADALFDAERVLHFRWSGDTANILPNREWNALPLRTMPNARVEIRRFAHFDAAMGKGGRSGTGDYSALAIAVLFPDGTFGLERIWARRASPSEQVAQIFDQHEDTPFEILTIEGGGFQELLVDLIEIERRIRARDGRRVDLPVQAVIHHRPKAARIGALEPLLTSGRLALGAFLDEEFWEELSNYPRCTHDDALDAAAGAIELARTRHGSGESAFEGSKAHRTKSPSF